MVDGRKPIHEGATPQVLNIDVNGANPQVTNIRGVMPQPLGDSIQGGVQPQHTSETGQSGGKPPAHE